MRERIKAILSKNSSITILSVIINLLFLLPLFSILSSIPQLTSSLYNYNTFGFQAVIAGNIFTIILCALIMGILNLFLQYQLASRDTIHKSTNAAWFYFAFIMFNTIISLLLSRISGTLSGIYAILSLFFYFQLICITVTQEKFADTFKIYARILAHKPSAIFASVGWLVLAGLSVFTIVAYWYLYPRLMIRARLVITDAISELESAENLINVE